MYQFALDAYIDLFVLSIEKSQRSPRLSERIENLNEYHTYSVYRYTCRGLFERHKLLFSFQICIKILEEMGKLNSEEYMFFLRGGIVIDRAHQMDNPVPNWLSSLSWDNMTELNKLPNYRGIVTSFEQYPRDWHAWYTSDEPENAKLPAEWEGSTNEFQRMLIVRSLRPDRVTFCATAFITNNIGKQFVEPPVLDMRSVRHFHSAYLVSNPIKSTFVSFILFIFPHKQRPNHKEAYRRVSCSSSLNSCNACHSDKFFFLIT